MIRYLLLAFLSIPVYASATSPPYRGGEVIIDLKNNKPCFYINDKNQKGIFKLVILNLSQDSTEYWEYENNFSHTYPTKANCILLTEKNFSNFRYLKENTPYSVTLGGLKKSYNKNFCVKKSSGKSILQDVQGAKCTDLKPSFWGGLKDFFIQMFS